MDTHIKGRFSSALFAAPGMAHKRGDPGSVPDDLVKLFGESQELHQILCGHSRIPPDQYWLVVQLSRMAKRIAELEDRTSSSEQADDGSGDPVFPKKRSPGRPRKHPEHAGAV